MLSSIQNIDVADLMPFHFHTKGSSFVVKIVSMRLCTRHVILTISEFNLVNSEYTGYLVINIQENGLLIRAVKLMR